jgi:hypothetical protein
MAANSSQGQYVGSPLQLIEHVKFPPSSLYRKCGRSDLSTARQLLIKVWTVSLSLTLSIGTCAALGVRGGLFLAG